MALAKVRATAATLAAKYCRRARTVDRRKYRSQAYGIVGLMSINSGDGGNYVDKRVIEDVRSSLGRRGFAASLVGSFLFLLLFSSIFFCFLLFRTFQKIAGLNRRK